MGEEGWDQSQENKGLVSQRNVTKVVELITIGELLLIEKETEEWQVHLLDNYYRTLNMQESIPVTFKYTNSLICCIVIQLTFKKF